MRNGGLRRAVRIGLWTLGILALIGASLATALVYPGTPSEAKSLKFQGYVVLPAGGGLSILDYLTVSGRDLFVTNGTGGQVYKIGLDAPFAGVAVLAGPPVAHGVAVDPESGLAYVSRSEANTVDIFDPATMRLLRRLPVANDVDGIFYDPASKLIDADSGDAKVGTLIDPATRSKVATIALGGAPEYAAIDPRSKLLYQNLKDLNAVAALDLSKRVAVGRWPLKGCEGPTGMAIDAPQRRLFVVCSGNAKLVVFNLDTHRVTGALPVGIGPDSVAYDPVFHRLYTTGLSGAMSVFTQESPDSYRQLDRIRLHFGAHTLAVDPVTHRVYAGYASLLLPPRVAVFAPEG